MISARRRHRRRPGVVPARRPGHRASRPHPGRPVPPHPRAGTAAGRPHCGSRAAVRAAPRSPPPPRSPRTTTPPAGASSGPHPCGHQSPAAAADPVLAGGAISASRPDECRAITFIGVPLQAGMSWSGTALVTLRGCARARPGQKPDCPVPVAQKILLQLAARNIGQLTDIEPPPPSAGRAGDPPDGTPSPVAGPAVGEVSPDCRKDRAGHDGPRARPEWLLHRAPSPYPRQGRQARIRPRANRLSDPLDPADG